jgi:hypothetical protein
MDIVKQYLTQSISAAAANLLLNSQQMEIISLIRDVLLKSEAVEDDLIRMKKITEFSTMAIKLHDMYSFLTKGPVDILTISEKFRNHSQQLVKDLNQLLIKTSDLRFALDKLRGNSAEKVPDLAPEKEEKNIVERQSNDEDNRRESSFSRFEESILKQIKPMDTALNEIGGDSLPDNVGELIEIMEKNSKLSRENGFDILSGMHSIVADSLKLIKDGTLRAEKDVIEALRSCLIVIAAVVRGKEVNISDYLNKAENFAETINALKNKEGK